VAGASFEISTQLASSEPEGFGDLCLLNRENILRWIDAYAATLASLRQNLEDGDTETLNEFFGAAALERAKWLKDRAEGQWDGDKGVGMPEKPNVLADAFLGGLWRKRRRKTDE
jgi:hypothetical protein